MNNSVVTGEFRGDTLEVGEGTVVGTNLFALIVCILTVHMLTMTIVIPYIFPETPEDTHINRPVQPTTKVTVGDTVSKDIFLLWRNRTVASPM